MVLWRKEDDIMKRGNGEPFDEILNDVWAMLERGVTHSNDPFHWPVLGTTGKQGCSLRTVILRRFILPDRILVCHTDARAAKAGEIRLLRKVSWLFYHPEKKVQLRISGEAKLHRDDSFADNQWAATRITSRLNYAATRPPGTPVDKPSSGWPDFLLEKAPTLLESEKSRKNFMAISCRIESMDWLMLGALGHRRVLFEWDEDRPHATWLIP
jgi:3-hydroxyisobutyrate dehydrogenase